MKKQRNFMGILKLFKPHKMLTMLVLFGALVGSVSELAWPIITRKILNEGLGRPWNEIKINMIYGLIGLIAMILLRVFGDWIMHEKASVLSDKVKYTLQKKIFAKYQAMSFSYFDNTRSGDVLALLDYDTNRLDEFVCTLTTETTSMIINVVGAIVIFSTMSPLLVAMILPSIIAIFMFNKIQGNVTFKAFRKLRNATKERISNAEDKLSGVRTISSFGKEADEIAQFNRSADKEAEESKHVWRLSFIRNAGNDMFGSILYVILLIGGGYLVSIGNMKLSDLTVFLMYSYIIQNPLVELSHMSRTYGKASASYEQIHNFLVMDEKIASPNNPMRPVIEGSVTIDNVSFRYDSDKKEDIISDLSLNVEPGKFVAIVGPSGSGKSTIAGLIPRYYEVNKGSVKVDGINVKDFDLGYLRRNIGVVQQDIYLFYGSVFDNIAYARPGATMEEVVQAAKLANADGFISDLPNGYNTNIGDRGVKLSGGQKQRIAIARIFLENPPIIIFDEATSALDNESEKEVQKAMENLSKRRTTIVIAHRLSTIKNADEIYYLTKNGIEEHGSHDELMQLGNKYAALYKATME